MSFAGFMFSEVILKTASESKIPLFFLNPACGSARSSFVSNQLYSSFCSRASNILNINDKSVIGLYFLGSEDGVGVFDIGTNIQQKQKTNTSKSTLELPSN